MSMLLLRESTTPSTSTSPTSTPSQSPQPTTIAPTTSPQENLHTIRTTSFLLHLIDPIRIYIPPPPLHPHPESFHGSPYVLVTNVPGDHDHDINSSKKLKRRLIDALAFICATEQDGGAGGIGNAAVCLEDWTSVGKTEEVGGSDGGERVAVEGGGYTLRIAKNGTVDPEVLEGVREIMRCLELFADGYSPTCTPPTANLYHVTDAQVYISIIKLHLSKIRLHLDEIRELVLGVRDALERHIEALLQSREGNGEAKDKEKCTASHEIIEGISTLSVPELNKLQTWLRTFTAQISGDEPNCDALPIAPVSAAHQVRRSPVFGHLEMLCRSLGCQVIGVHLGKLARYKAACKTLMHACQKWPGMFVGMKVCAVGPDEGDIDGDVYTSGGASPGIAERLTREEEIRRVVGAILHDRDDAGPSSSLAVEEGVQALLPTISEEQFITAWDKRACITHAETRLITFYDQNPDAPRPISGSTDKSEVEVRYIGLSKKPCYLCSLFVSRHRGNWILGGLESEKANGGPLKRVLDPSWWLAPAVVENEEVRAQNYPLILDEMKSVVEAELRVEVERWVSRGGEEDVVGRDRGRARGKVKGKRLVRKSKARESPPSNTSSSDGGVSLGAGLGRGIDVMGVHKVEKIPESTTPAAAMSDDEGDGVRLASTGQRSPNNEPSEVDTPLPLADDQIPDLIFPTADIGFDHAFLASTLPIALSPPPPTSLIDEDPEIIPSHIRIASPVPFPDIPIIPYTQDTTDTLLPHEPTTEVDAAAIPAPASPRTEEFHSETQFLDEEAAAEFKLLTPIPEEEDDVLVLVNFESILVRLADEGVFDRARKNEDAAMVGAEPAVVRERTMSDAQRDLAGLDFSSVPVVENSQVEAETATGEDSPAETDMGVLGGSKGDDVLTALAAVTMAPEVKVEDTVEEAAEGDVEEILKEIDEVKVEDTEEATEGDVEEILKEIDEVKVEDTEEAAEGGVEEILKEIDEVKVEETVNETPMTLAEAEQSEESPTPTLSGDDNKQPNEETPTEAESLREDSGVQEVEEPEVPVTESSVPGITASENRIDEEVVVQVREYVPEGKGIVREDVEQMQLPVEVVAEVDEPAGQASNFVESPNPDIDEPQPTETTEEALEEPSSSLPVSIPAPSANPPSHSSSLQAETQPTPEASSSSTTTALGTSPSSSTYTTISATSTIINFPTTITTPIPRLRSSIALLFTPSSLKRASTAPSAPATTATTMFTISNSSTASFAPSIMDISSPVTPSLPTGSSFPVSKEPVQDDAREHDEQNKPVKNAGSGSGWFLARRWMRGSSVSGKSVEDAGTKAGSGLDASNSSSDPAGRPGSLVRRESAPPGVGSGPRAGGSASAKALWALRGLHAQVKAKNTGST